jgi:hypothetical protein
LMIIKSHIENIKIGKTLLISSDSKSKSNVNSLYLIIF